MKFLRILLCFALFGIAFSATAQKVGQIRPARDATGGVVPGAIIINTAFGHVSAAYDTSYCAGNDRVYEYTAVGNSTGYVQGDLVYQQVVDGACVNTDSLQSYTGGVTYLGDTAIVTTTIIDGDGSAFTLSIPIVGGNITNCDSVAACLALQIGRSSEIINGEKITCDTIKLNGVVQDVACDTLFLGGPFTSITSGTDSYGNDYPAGSQLLVTPGYDTVCLNKAYTITASGDGTDVNGDPYTSGTPLIVFGNGDTLCVGKPLFMVASNSGTDSFNNDFTSGDIIIQLPNGQTLCIPQKPVSSTEPIILNGDTIGWYHFLNGVLQDSTIYPEIDASIVDRVSNDTLYFSDGSYQYHYIDTVTLADGTIEIYDCVSTSVQGAAPTLTCQLEDVECLPICLTGFEQNWGGHDSKRIDTIVSGNCDTLIKEYCLPSTWWRGGTCDNPDSTFVQYCINGVAFIDSCYQLEPSMARITADTTDGNAIQIAFGGTDCEMNDDSTDCSRTYNAELYWQECESLAEFKVFDVEITCGGLVFDWSNSQATLTPAEQSSIESEYTMTTFPFIDYDKEAVYLQLAGATTAFGALNVPTEKDCPIFEDVWRHEMETASCPDSNVPEVEVPVYDSPEVHAQIIEVDVDADGTIMGKDYLYFLYVIEKNDCLSNRGENHCYRSFKVNLIGQSGKTAFVGRTIEFDKQMPLVNGKYQVWVEVDGVRLFQYSGNPCYYDSALDEWFIDYVEVDGFNSSIVGPSNGITREFEIDYYMGLVNGKSAFIGAGNLAQAQLTYYWWTGTAWTGQQISDATTAPVALIQDGMTIGDGTDQYRSSDAGAITGLYDHSNGDLYASTRATILRKPTGAVTTVLVVKFDYTGTATLADRLDGENYIWNILAGEDGWGDVTGSGTVTRFGNNNGAPSQDVYVDESQGVETIYVTDIANDKYKVGVFNNGTSSDVSDNYTWSDYIGSGVGGVVDGAGVAALINEPYDFLEYDANTWLISDRVTVRLVDKATGQTRIIEGGNNGATNTTNPY